MYRHCHGLLYVFVIEIYSSLNHVIIIQTNILSPLPSPSGIGDLKRFWLFCLGPFGFLAA